MSDLGCPDHRAAPPRLPARRRPPAACAAALPHTLPTPRPAARSNEGTSLLDNLAADLEASRPAAAAAAGAAPARGQAAAMAEQAEEGQGLLGPSME